SAGAAAVPANEPAQASAITVGADVERMLGELDRQERSARQRLDFLDKESARLHAQSVARGRAYVELSRAGLLPVGAGFEALIEHAARLERLHSALARDVTEEHKTDAERLQLSKKLDELRTRRGPLEAEQRAIASASSALLSERDRSLAFERAFS